MNTQTLIDILQEKQDANDGIPMRVYIGVPTSEEYEITQVIQGLNENDYESIYIDVDS